MDRRPTNPKDPSIRGVECKHAFYVEAQDGSEDDLVYVKERIHYHDGSTRNNVRVFENYEQDFYITKPNFRNHNDKKEWEDISRLQKFKSTRSKMGKTVAKLLNKNLKNANLRQLARSQYLYGTDITTPTLIKRRYMDAYENCISGNNVAVLDIETDVVHGTEEIVMVSITYKDRSVTAYVKSFMDGVDNPIPAALEAIDKYIGQWAKPRNTQFEILEANTPGEAVAMVMARCHEWQPDFLTIWNIDFDLPRCISAVEKAGLRVVDVFCDPSLPEKYKYAKYIKGNQQKVTASGKVTSIANHDQWHVFDCPASFYIIDSMCLYRKLRVAAGNEPSYALNAILDKHLGIRKLNFTEADGLSQLDWHIFMQRRYKILYLVYNIFDCMAVELLDEKIKDLQSSISIQCEHSEYSKLPSQPRRTCDDLHFYVQKQYGKIIASTSDAMVDELDKYVLPMTDWIVTLPAHLTVANGLACMPEVPGFRTLIRAHVADLDVSSSYPNTEDILNISKETTLRELCKIKGIPEFVQREAGINLTGGHVNAVEICNNILQFPDMNVVLKQYQIDRASADRMAA